MINEKTNKPLMPIKDMFIQPMSARIFYRQSIVDFCQESNMSLNESLSNAIKFFREELRKSLVSTNYEMFETEIQQVMRDAYDNQEQPCYIVIINTYVYDTSIQKETKMKMSFKDITVESPFGQFIILGTILSLLCLGIWVCKRF